jgi:hypothetical protein
MRAFSVVASARDNYSKYSSVAARKLAIASSIVSPWPDFSRDLENLSSISLS